MRATPPEEPLAAWLEVGFPPSRMFNSAHDLEEEATHVGMLPQDMIPSGPVEFNDTPFRSLACSEHGEDAPEAAGERFIAVARFLWMAEVAAVLRERLGDAAAKVPKRAVPNPVVRAMGLFDPRIRSIAGDLGKKVEMSSEKAQSLLGWSPRPVEETIVDCARSLAQHT